MLRRATFSLFLCLFVSASQLATAAGPALLIEASTGKVLYSEHADHQWHPASLTKIMTAYLTFEALKAGKITLASKINCSARAHKEPPSKIGLPVGAKMSVRLAIKALVIKSANDVAVMLAEAIGGSQEAFVAKMNATARRLGMTRTRFVNPNGLPAKAQVTTARDLATLARAILRDFPEQQSIWKQASFRIGKRQLRSYNSLLRTFKGADGMKTGFICDSGYNVVASATRNGRKLIAVVLGANSGMSRGRRAAKLLEHGFATYGWKTYFNATSLANMPMDVRAHRAISIRRTVHSAACGYHPPRRRLTGKALARAKATKRRRAARLRKAKIRKARKRRAAAKRRKS